jgi:hypothetical protein
MENSNIGLIIQDEPPLYSKPIIDSVSKGVN